MCGATLFKNFKERRVLNNNKQGMMVIISIKISCYVNINDKTCKRSTVVINKCKQSVLRICAKGCALTFKDKERFSGPSV